MSKYGVGLRNAGSFRVSGQPYLSGAVTPAGTAFSSSVFGFPYVSKRIIVTNDNEVTGGIISFVPYLPAQATAEGFSTDASNAGNW